MLRQHRLDLSQLHPLASYLHLLIPPSYKVQIPILSPSHQVSRPVQPLSSSSCSSCGSTVRMRHKLLRRQSRIIHIPGSYSRSAYPQLPYHPHRHRLHPLPQHINTHIINRPSYRHSRLPPSFSRLPPVVRANIRALGRPVGVHHLRLESLALPPLPQVTNIDRLSSQHHAPQAPQTRIAFLSLLLFFLLFLLFLFFLLFLLPLASSLSPSPGLQHC